MISSSSKAARTGLLEAVPTPALLVIAVLLIGSAGILWAAGRRSAPVEDPGRVTRFLGTLGALDWSPEASPAAADALYRAITGLFEAEIRYYYRARTVRRRAAFAARAGAYVFGTVGLLCPLLATAVPAWQGLTAFGYLFFAAAAACLGGNELFGGTRGHVRAVGTQYRLEALLNSFAVEWQRWRASYQLAQSSERGALLGTGFDLLNGLMSRVYAAMDEETKDWGHGVVDAEAAYRSEIGKRKPGVG